MDLIDGIKVQEVFFVLCYVTKFTTIQIMKKCDIKIVSANEQTIKKSKQHCLDWLKMLFCINDRLFFPFVIKYHTNSGWSGHYTWIDLCISLSRKTFSIYLCCGYECVPSKLIFVQFFPHFNTFVDFSSIVSILSWIFSTVSCVPLKPIN